MSLKHINTNYCPIILLQNIQVEENERRDNVPAAREERRDDNVPAAHARVGNKKGTKRKPTSAAAAVARSANKRRKQQKRSCKR